MGVAYTMTTRVLHLFTDGSCFHNGRVDAYGGIGVYEAPDSLLNLSEGYPGGGALGRITNQTMELLACIRALEQVERVNAMTTSPVSVVLYTDSKYVVMSMTTWIKAWMQNGWKTRFGAPVKNRVLLQRLQGLGDGGGDDRIVNGVIYRHVRGHQQRPITEGSEDFFLWQGNDMANAFAVRGAEGLRRTSSFAK
jgi:ribonuclease HI